MHRAWLGVAIGGLTIGALSNATRGIAGEWYGDYVFNYAGSGGEGTMNELIEAYIKPKLGL